MLSMTLALFKVATSNVLVDKMRKSEREVIKEWLENIFKTWEKTNELQIKEFKLTQMKHERPLVNENGCAGKDHSKKRFNQDFFI